MGISFSQPERESLLELMHFAIYADTHISLIEEDLLTQLIGGLGWDSPRPESVFLLLTGNRVRDMLSRSAEEIDTWIRGRADIFSSHKTRAAALATLNRLLRADGTGLQETALYRRLSSHLEDET